MMSTVARKSLSKKTPKHVSFGVFFLVLTAPVESYEMVYAEHSPLLKIAANDGKTGIAASSINFTGVLE